MKKPSVCTDSDGVQDIAVENVTSLLFQKKNYIDLKEKLVKLINSKELRTKLGENARQRVMDNFNIEKLTDRTIDFYNKEIIN